VPTLTATLLGIATGESSPRSHHSMGDRCLVQPMRIGVLDCDRPYVSDLVREYPDAFGPDYVAELREHPRSSELDLGG
jgi:hypothetical protein